MADKSKGFKAAGGSSSSSGSSSGFKNAAPAAKSKIQELPRPKFNIPWRWLAALVALPVLFHQCSQDDPATPRWKKNTDTAPKQTGHDWLDKMNKRNAERAAEGLPPLKRDGEAVSTSSRTPPAAAAAAEQAPRTFARSRAQELRDRQARFKQEEALPGGPGMDARRAGFQAVFSELYNLPQPVSREIDRIMAHRDPGKAIYDVVQIDRTQKMHIASAAVTPDNTVNSFVCVEKGLLAQDFYHAQAAPNGKGGYSVAISSGIPHAGNYMTGRNLMEVFGNKNCETGLRQLHEMMNGTGETDALNTKRSVRESERIFNDRGMKGQYQ